MGVNDCNGRKECSKKGQGTRCVLEVSPNFRAVRANKRMNKMNFSRDNDPANSLDWPAKYEVVGFHCYGESPLVVGFVPLAHNAPGGALKWRTRNFMGRVKKE